MPLSGLALTEILVAGDTWKAANFRPVADPFFGTLGDYPIVQNPGFSLVWHGLVQTSHEAADNP